MCGINFSVLLRLNGLLNLTFRNDEDKKRGGDRGGREGETETKKVSGINKRLKK